MRDFLNVFLSVPHGGVARISQWESNGGGLRAETPALGDFCNFSPKITHFYAYFGQNSYFKAIT